MRVLRRAFGATPHPALLATASGTAFAAIVLGHLANAVACRSETRWVGRVGIRGNRLLLYAVVVELGMLAIPAVWLADTAHKALRARR